MANKRYDQFSAGTPTGSNITLFADPSTGALSKCDLQTILNLQPQPGSLLQMLQTLGSPIKSFNLNLQFMGGYVRLQVFENSQYWWLNYLPACTVTGVWYSYNQVNNVTNTGFAGFGLYSISGTTCTLVAQTANTPSFFTGTLNVFSQAPFTSPLTVSAGTYYLVMQCPSSAQVSRCQIYANAYTQNHFTQTLGMANGYATVATRTPNTTLPSTINPSSFTVADSSDPIPLMGIY